MRILSDELYARVIKVLMQDENVALFQELVMAPKAEPTDDETKIKEVENGIQQSNSESKTRNNRA